MHDGRSAKSRSVCVDVEDLYDHSMDWRIAEENAFYEKTKAERRKELKWFNEQTVKYDADLKWALFLHPNSNETLRTFLLPLEFEKDDVFLDIGAGDGRLSLIALQERQIKEAWAIEWNRYWVRETRRYIKEKYGSMPQGFHYRRKAYQEFEFPEDVTKCAFVAWHNGPKTQANIMKKLERTQCTRFVHNFGTPHDITVVQL